MDTSLRPPGRGADPAAAAEVAEQRLAQVTRRLPAGESRPQQVAMARAVAESLAGGRHLVVQAGTGTGKSLAYLVPAVASGRPVVVATATKALQDQLADKDLPMVDEAFGGQVAWAVLKGRSNYLCLQRAREVDQRGFQQALDEGPGTEEEAQGPATDPEDPGSLADQVRRLVAWAATSRTGDRADLDFEPNPRAWAMVSVGPRECPGAFRCPSGGDCFAEAARAAAAAADVVVVNTHLYGSHLASGGAVLPPHDVVVFDEAHELEEVMTASLGVELAPGRLRALATLARPLVKAEGAEAIDDLLGVADRLSAELAGRLGTRVLDAGGGTEAPPERRAAAERGPTAAERAAADRVLEDLLGLAGARVATVLALVRRGEQPALGEQPSDGGRAARALSAGGHVAEDLARLAGRGDDDVAWVDGSSRAPVLRLSPIDVGPPLAAALWGQVTAVLTTATMPLHLPERLGLEADSVVQLDVGSPFDYRSHALLYVARHLPDRRDPGSEPALHDELEALIEAAGGRTLALFTSHRATESAHAALSERLGVRLLLQGQLPKNRLLEAFAEDETSCLFATLGFWQGVDVPGRSLILVTVDRLPFARPDDPLLQARRDRAGEAAFRLVDLPRAGTLLAQGAGRLIRTASDRGVVAVLDPRLATAGYRGALLAGVPPMRRVTERRQVEDFLAAVVAGGQ